MNQQHSLERWGNTLNTPIDMIPRFKKVFMIGIGGSGMCGIAEILLKLGFEVQGSDIKDSSRIKALRALGAQVIIGHAEDNLGIDTDVVVYSSAVDQNHVEMKAAKKLKILRIRRAEMLAELVRFGYGIAVAGTHGKSSTTSMIECIFSKAGLRPTFVVGGRVKRAKEDRHQKSSSHAALGESRYFILEADESDASFKHIHPIITVITNIEADHMETYAGSLDNLKNAFRDFLYNLPFYGCAVVYNDDKNVQEVIEDLQRHVRTYGLSEDSDYQLSNIKIKGLTTFFDLKMPKGESASFKLSVPGVHNALNATAAIAVAREEGISLLSIQEALAQFRSIGRRFDVYPLGEYTFVDDYGHHPTEIEVTVKTARESFPNQRVITVFQPHRYSRLKQLFEQFVKALELSDQVIIQSVYSAGEAPIQGFKSEDLCNELRSRGQVLVHHAQTHEKTLSLLLNQLQKDDVVLIQGAGDISQLMPMIQATLMPDASGSEFVF